MATMGVPLVILSLSVLKKKEAFILFIAAFGNGD